VVATAGLWPTAVGVGLWVILGWGTGTWGTAASGSLGEIRVPVGHAAREYLPVRFREIGRAGEKLRESVEIDSIVKHR
jgi:hypothetical protein